jgi:hypothetical protein
MFKALFNAFRFLATYLKVDVDVVSQRIATCPYLAQVGGRGLGFLMRAPVYDSFDYGGHCGS